MRLSRHEWGLVAVVAVVFLAHLVIITSPLESYVFDEAFYVPAAKCMLNGTVCNVEHPPLAKALIAGSIRAFGDYGLGWRMPSVILGTASIILVFFLVRRLGGDGRTAFLASFLLGFDSLWFTHSSIAMLDIIAHFFMLLGVYLFARGNTLWAGAVLGLAVLSKEITILALPILLLFVAIIAQNKMKSLLKTSLKLGIPLVLVFLVGLGAYDLMSGAFPTPFHHIARIMHHNQAFDAPGIGAADVHPLRWFSGFDSIAYFVTTVKAGDKELHDHLQYRGVANLVVLLPLWLALPFAIVEARRKTLLALLSLLLFGIVYLIMIALAFTRITYPFYMLQIIPFICIINAQFLSRFPRSVLAMYCLGVFAWFAFWFPLNIFVV